MRLQKVFYLLFTLLLFTLPSGCSSAPSAESLIIDVDENSLVKVKEEDAIAFYKQNKQNLQSLASYLLTHETLFESRPVILTKDYNIGNIGDKAILGFAEKLFANGIFTNIWSENNDPEMEVHFIIGGELDVYEQGFLYTSNLDIAKTDPTVYNNVKRYQSMGDGWFYYIHHYDAVKDADKYRDIWNSMDYRIKKRITADWKKALVTIEDWNGELVVVVSYHTEQDGYLSPIKIHLDPVTAKLAGSKLQTSKKD